MRRKKIKSYAIALLVSVTAYGQDSAKWQTEISIVGDYISNLKGGIKQGEMAIGHVNLGANYQTGNSGFWKNGEINLFVHKTSNGSASETLIGDAQVASNIEGTSSKLFYELWVKQSVGQFSILAGLHDMNTEFYASRYGAFFINSSFGIGPSFSLNMPVSIYPVTTLGGVFKWDNGTFTIAEGMYNMSHEFAEEETFHWKNNNFSKGFLSVTEASYAWKQGDKILGHYKLGGFYKNCEHDKTTYIDYGCNAPEDFGAFLIADQTLFQTETKELGLFLQAAVCPHSSNATAGYYGAGLSFKGFLTKSGDDQLGIGIAHAAIASLDANYNYTTPGEYETAVELSFEYPLFKRISIQPDVQYIFNPGGSGQLSNALVAIFRTKIDLN